MSGNSGAQLIHYPSPIALGFGARTEVSWPVDALYPTIFIEVAATLLAVAALVCMIPAWKASRIDPMQVLRNERALERIFSILSRVSVQIIDRERGI